MRIALYLRERAHVGARDRVALVANLGPEWTVTTWAALTHGAAVGFIDPGLPDAELASQLLALGPRVVLAPDDVARRIAARRIPGVETIVSFGGSFGGADGAERPEGIVTWTEALDLGGASTRPSEPTRSARTRRRSRRRRRRWAMRSGRTEA